MVLTKAELLAALQNEVRILLHLADKIDPSMLEYRPTPKQRSTLELLRYLSIMGPTFVEYGITGSQDPEIWNRAAAAADARDFAQTMAAIASQHDGYARLLGDVPDDVFRRERSGITGVTSTGASLVNVVLCGCAAYRMQLFLYLKACGREDLGTMNLWAGMDAPAPAVS